MAEDQAINMQVVKGQLESQGLLEQSEFYYNGQEAFNRSLQLFEEAGCATPIDLMLIDQQMPLMTGMELIKNIRDYLKVRN